MKHNKKKMLIILEELMKLFMKLGATNIAVNFDMEEEQCTIRIKGNYEGKSARYFQEIAKCLNCGRNEEVEECYWSISGSSEINQDSELYIVGSMLDQCTLNFSETELEIVGYRKL
ncbi:hypothetical protein [Chakrabartyella piscis]|uniref:hypothetical protein n=1 Tax=Chakrabartyella piscis TaxID=2918914 RepID=UPI00295895B8|nr:hypothetical protein [Chakrabartyella piscis]